MAKANLERVTQTFLDLVRIDSPTFKEQAIAERLMAELDALGLAVEHDRSGPDGVGNLIGRLPGGTGLPIALSAHLDTVQPGEGIRPIVQDGVVRSEGETILGADDQAGLAAILETLRVLRESELSRPPLEVVLTWGEERAHLGARLVDVSKLHAKLCFVPDAEGDVGTIIAAAPSYESISATFVGAAAHAGMEPEQGRSAILAAARAIVRTPLGRLDEDTTCNVGLVSGGSVRNAVPARATIEAEARSLDDGKLDRVLTDLREGWEAAAAETGCTLEYSSRREYRAYRLAEDDPAVRLARAGAQAAGVPYRAVATGGGSDANTFAELGLPSVCLSAAMRRPHTRDEHIATADLGRLADFLLGIVAAAAPRGSNGRAHRDRPEPAVSAPTWASCSSAAEEPSRRCWTRALTSTRSRPRSPGRSRGHGELHARLPATDDPTEVGPADLLLFCVKTYDNDATIPGLRPMVGPNTAILTVQNGLATSSSCPRRTARTQCSAERWLAAGPGLLPVSSSTSCRPSPSTSKWARSGRRQVSTLSWRAPSLSPPGWRSVVEDIQLTLWAKLLAMGSLSALGCLTRLGTAEWRGHPATRELYATLVGEAASVARAEEIALDDATVDQALAQPTDLVRRTERRCMPISKARSASRS